MAAEILGFYSVARCLVQCRCLVVACTAKYDIGNHNLAAKCCGELGNFGNFIVPGDWSSCTSDRVFYVFHQTFPGTFPRGWLRPHRCEKTH